MTAPGKKTILLNGPDPRPDQRAFYGGGLGGSARNMRILLDNFRSAEIALEPCYYSVRRQGRFRQLHFPRRLVADTLQVLRRAPGADGIHVFGQYRTATYREYAIALASRALGLPMLYQIRAGAFIDWYRHSGPLPRHMIATVLRSARIILCEGEPYVRFLADEFGLRGHHFPNFVPAAEIPAEVPARLTHDGPVTVLFIGYCYRGKGVFELVEGCRLAAERGLAITLTLIGQEHPDFARWLDHLDLARRPLAIVRQRKLPHHEVLKRCLENDIFCMPTRHRGEGHTNTINEAMMTGMVIVCTRHGFLETVLGDQCAFFLDACSPRAIAHALAHIARNRDQARAKARAARDKVLAAYSSDAAFTALEAHYRDLGRDLGTERGF